MDLNLHLIPCGFDPENFWHPIPSPGYPWFQVWRRWLCPDDSWDCWSDPDHRWRPGGRPGGPKGWKLQSQRPRGLRDSRPSRDGADSASLDPSPDPMGTREMELKNRPRFLFKMTNFCERPVSFRCHFEIVDFNWDMGQTYDSTFFGGMNIIPAGKASSRLTIFA